MGIFGSIKGFFAFNYNILADAPTLTAEQERGLALGAVYASEGDLPINALTMEADARTAAKVLHGPWGVVDTESARESYQYLLTSGHRGIYQVVRPYLAELGAVKKRSEYVAVQRRAAQELPEVAQRHQLAPQDLLRHFNGYAGTIYEVKRNLPEQYPKSIAGWDAARVVHVSRLFLDAGFIEPDEAWAAIAQAVRLARAEHTSWAEFNGGFLFGRAFWQMGLSGANAEKIGRDASTFQFNAERLLTREDSPWVRLPW
ncbi:DUF1266 domain-containing protein [Kitasatospora sp. NBC_01287]|uniref:DUF1266 domain-containing protein n=1 Tax=Kitasatospora sp. NBC_01287 TaxID=2903573 RepID=UPI002255109E|nr:DUF1266 domain-containing protein [Kitasatospora sp. NBC_01287]MCX4751508.1 DUF1266 domain-containing protein [Kitasatospora sp. NBC_01287]